MGEPVGPQLGAVPAPRPAPTRRPVEPSPIIPRVSGTIVLYGATGYTGRLVADALADRGLAFVLAGRSAERLRAVGAEHPGVPVEVAGLDGPAALRDLLADAAVVVNCAGPFTVAGDAVPAAAVATGTHYLDSTGEQQFMSTVFDRHGAAARRAGVALVPACGFDYVPGDCLARIVARDLEPLDELVLAYHLTGFQMTRGTLRSGLVMLRGDDLDYAGGRWRPAPSGVLRASFPFPPPVGRRAVTRYPSGEVLTVPRHSRVRRVRSFLAAENAAPHPALAGVLPYLQPLLAPLARGPLAAAAMRAIGRLPEGPPEDERRVARWRIAVDARGEDGHRAGGLVQGADVYGLTATSLAWAAERLAQPAYDRAGPMGPGAAFDPEELLGALARHDVTWTTSPPR